jgi:hypothetical protein
MEAHSGMLHWARERVKEGLAGRQPITSRELLENISLRVDRLVVHFDEVMQVGACGVTRRAHKTDEISTFDLLPVLHQDFREMPVLRFEAKTVVDGDNIPHLGIEAGNGHSTSGRCLDRSIGGRADI